MQTWSGGSTHSTMPNFLETGLSKADIAIFQIFKKSAAAATLNFWNCNILLPIWVERVETHQHAKFRQNRSIGCKDIKMFRFFKMVAAAILDFRIRKILFADDVWRAHTHHYTKFRQNWLFNCGDREIFRMATAAFLDYQNCKILLPIWVEKVETHQRAKFRQNWSIGFEAIKIFRLFKMAAATILDCRIRKILMADAVWRSRPITVPNFVKICRSIAEISRFFEFFRSPPPQSWIFKIAKFYWLLGWKGSRPISMPNFVKIGQLVAKILKFSIFQDGSCRHLELLNLQNFIGWRCLEGPYASLYQISSKSVIRCGDIAIFANFQNGRRRHLGFLKSWSFIGYWGGKGRDASVCQILLKSVNRLRRY